MEKGSWGPVGRKGSGKLEQGRGGEDGEKGVWQAGAGAGGEDGGEKGLTKLMHYKNALRKSNYFTCI